MIFSMHQNYPYQNAHEVYQLLLFRLVRGRVIKTPSKLQTEYAAFSNAIFTVNPLFTFRIDQSIILRYPFVLEGFFFSTICNEGNL